MSVSGFLCKYGFAGGWPSIYYIFGILGVAWCVIWFVYAADSPLKHRWISEKERIYIEDSLKEAVTENEEKKPTVPWMEIMKSPAVWALFGGQFAADWGANMVMTSLPLFMNDVLGLDFMSMGAVSAIPYLAYFICINAGCFIADKVQNYGLLSTLNTRRIAMIISMVSQAAFLVGSSYCTCNQHTLVIVFMTLGIGLSGFSYAGYLVNYLDIAPAFAGPIFGISQTISSIAGIVAPLIVGWLTPQGTRDQWQLVFWITVIILLAGTIIFCLFAKGDVQQWAVIKESQKNESVDMTLNPPRLIKRITQKFYSGSYSF